MITDWEGCYDASWKGIITPESFAHPAKMAKTLAERIYAHGETCGYWQPGAAIVDPFGGIATTAIVGAYRGYRVIGVELERHFYELGNANIDRHAPKLQALGKPVPLHVQGDSRNLREIVGAAMGAITSPPYADQAIQKNSGGIDLEKQYDTYRKSGGGASFEAFKRTQLKHSGHYSDQPSGAITSPPYADSAQSRDAEFTLNATAVNPTPRTLGTRTYYPAEQTTPGQLGAMKVATYWEAVATIYRELYELLPPGGAAAVVVKDYIKKGKRVQLCDQTAEVLEACGFNAVERCRAWLVKERTALTLFGDDHTTRTERKSFFRRLAERNGSPRIDYEEVIWAIK